MSDGTTNMFFATLMVAGFVIVAIAVLATIDESSRFLRRRFDRWLTRRRRRRAGWRTGTVQELLNLTDEEAAEIEARVKRETSR